MINLELNARNISVEQLNHLITDAHCLATEVIFEAEVSLFTKHFMSSPEQK